MVLWRHVILQQGAVIFDEDGIGQKIRSSHVQLSPPRFFEPISGQRITIDDDE
jgi:hypothetical protein